MFSIPAHISKFGRFPSNRAKTRAVQNQVEQQVASLAIKMLVATENSVVPVFYYGQQSYI